MSKNDNGGRVTPDIQFRAFISKHKLPLAGLNLLELYLTLASIYGRNIARNVIFDILLATDNIKNDHKLVDFLLNLRNTLIQNK